MQQINMFLKFIHSNFITQRTQNALPTNEEKHQNDIQNQQIKISHFKQQPTWAISKSIIENSLTNTDQFILHNNSTKKVHTLRPLGQWSWQRENIEGGRQMGTIPIEKLA